MAVNISKLHTPRSSLYPARTSAMRLQSTERDENVIKEGRFKRLEALVQDIAKGMTLTDERLKKIEKSNQDIARSIQNLLKVQSKDSDISALDLDKVHCEIHLPFNINELLTAPDQVLRSKQVKYAGALWYLLIKKRKKDEEDFLAVFLHCDRLLKSVSYETFFTIRLIGSVQEDVVVPANAIFDEKVPGSGLYDFITWSKLSNFANGFLDEKGNAIVKVDFSARGISNIEAVSVNEFSSSFVSDCVILIENRRVEVNKGFLSVYSRYFNTLFNGAFRESSQEEIKIDGVSVAEFITLLEAIYPPHRDHKITETNVECLLHLADRFQVSDVVTRCEDFLLKCLVSKISTPRKLVLAQDYQLTELQELCFKKFKSLEEIKRLQLTKEYATLKNDIKVQLYEHFTKNA